jgi:hypothetical protein
MINFNPYCEFDFISKNSFYNTCQIINEDYFYVKYYNIEYRYFIKDKEWWEKSTTTINNWIPVQNKMLYFKALESILISYLRETKLKRILK